MYIHFFKCIYIFSSWAIFTQLQYEQEVLPKLHFSDLPLEHHLLHRLAPDMSHPPSRIRFIRPPRSCSLQPLHPGPLSQDPPGPTPPFPVPRLSFVSVVKTVPYLLITTTLPPLPISRTPTVAVPTVPFPQGMRLTLSLFPCSSTSLC